MKKLARRVIRDESYRRYMGVKAAFAVDALWAGVNIVLGILQSSIWFITLGAYYMVFGATRLVLWSCLRSGPNKRAKAARRVEKACGIMLLVSIFVLSGIVTLVMKDLGGFVYDELLIYAMATFAFYSLVSSLVSYVKLRKRDDIIAITNSRVNLAIALVSIFAVEIAMLTAFGTSEDEQLRFIMPILTGTGIAMVIAFFGIRSIRGRTTRPGATLSRTD